MDVSVIIAAYNVESYIRRAIDSALNQQGVAVEVIVIDDSSTDGTWNIISAITDPRLKAIKFDYNGGPGAARNAGLAKAAGEWVAILDGDDEFEAGRLVRCITHAKQKKADIIVDNLIIRREEDDTELPMFPIKALTKTTVLDSASFIKGTLSNKNHYTLGYLKPILLRSFLQKHHLSYDTELRIGEDYLLMMKALLSGAHCVVEPTAGYLYTVRAGSISYRLALADVKQMLKADEQLMANYALDYAAKAAQFNRTKWLKKKYAFAQLIDAIKQKNGSGALKAIISYPSCVWWLWYPLKVRIKRLGA